MQKQKNQDPVIHQDKPVQPANATESSPSQAVEELGGFKGPEPTRFGDWEKHGRCIDF
jgi:hypothetical protein